ncbi:MAG: SoxR reducing system RseC family protein [Syntrophales bacterium]|nr:SoxR reducing system RseC family protein [Syntrophales bacterium]
MQEEATVLEIINENLAKLEVVKSEACGSCNACFEGSSGKKLLFAENSLGAKEGDRVRIEINSAAVAKLSFLVYMIPLTGLVLGALLTGQLTDSEGMTALGSLGGFFTFSIFTYFYLRKTKPKESYAPRITKVFR